MSEFDVKNIKLVLFEVALRVSGSYFVCLLHVDGRCLNSREVRERCCGPGSCSGVHCEDEGSETGVEPIVKVLAIDHLKWLTLRLPEELELCGSTLLLGKLDSHRVKHFLVQ